MRTNTFPHPYDDPAPHRGPRRRGGHHGGPRGFGPMGGGFGFDPMGDDEMPDPRGRARGRRGGPGRGRRGDVRAAILALLAEQPMNGYQLIAAIAEKSQGLWKPSAGSVYPALGLLEDEGLIEPTQEEGKKLFTLTDAGRAHAEEHADEQSPWERVAGPHKGFLDIRPQVGQLAMALQQVAMTGDEQQIQAARDIVDKARKDIYRILAGDDVD